MAEVSEGLVQGRTRLGWMDGVKVALGNRGMTVEAARQCAKDLKEWRALVHVELNAFHAAIFAWHSVLSDSPSVLWWLSHGEGRMSLHDAVGLNCKNGALLKIKAQVSSIWAKGCILMTVCVCVCVLSDLT